MKEFTTFYSKKLWEIGSESRFVDLKVVNYYTEITFSRILRCCEIETYYLIYTQISTVLIKYVTAILTYTIVNYRNYLLSCELTQFHTKNVSCTLQNLGQFAACIHIQGFALSIVYREET